MILLGDCLDRLKELGDNSVDAVVTDPPYGLKFMGKKWDYDLPKVEAWREVHRVLKPGGHLLGFGGTRTYHRLVCSIEDAGFEIRDQIMWLYGSGFPKSHDISKGIDKAAGVERQKVQRVEVGGVVRKADCEHGWKNSSDNSLTFDKTGITDAAKQWQGWGTALKPANEPIVLARKPLSESTVAKNVLKWGVGGLNIDASRIEASDQSALAKNWDRMQSENNEHGKITREGGKLGAIDLSDRAPSGRWPANLILGCTCASDWMRNPTQAFSRNRQSEHKPDCPVRLLDEQSGTLKTNPGKIKSTLPGNVGYGGYARIEQEIKADSGGASRFFYCAKASKSERNFGLKKEKALVDETKALPNDSSLISRSVYTEQISLQNTHPTVKPIKLMEYLIKLITPPGGTVLDPFMGSGSTGVAAYQLGFKFIGIEMNKEYVAIAKRRTKRALECQTTA